MKGRERVDRFFFFLERRRRLVKSFLEKVSGEEIVRNSFSNKVSYWKVYCLSCRLRLCHHIFLCVPKTRLLGRDSLGLTIYLYSGLGFPTLDRSCAETDRKLFYPFLLVLSSLLLPSKFFNNLFPSPDHCIYS